MFVAAKVKRQVSHRAGNRSLTRGARIQPDQNASNERGVTSMTEVLVEVGWVRVTKGPVALPELVGNGGPQIDFNNLQCLCEQIPQGKVELVRCYDIFECCSANEIMPLQFKCKTIATEAVVIQMGEELLRGLRISNRETTLLEQLDLSSVGKPRF